jgi:hypothetical protein
MTIEEAQKQYEHDLRTIREQYNPSRRPHKTPHTTLGTSDPLFPKYPLWAWWSLFWSFIGLLILIIQVSA